MRCGVDEVGHNEGRCEPAARGFGTARADNLEIGPGVSVVIGDLDGEDVRAGVVSGGVIVPPGIGHRGVGRTRQIHRRRGEGGLSVIDIRVAVPAVCGVVGEICRAGAVEVKRRVAAIAGHGHAAGPGPVRQSRGVRHGPALVGLEVVRELDSDLADQRLERCRCAARGQGDRARRCAGGLDVELGRIAAVERGQGGGVVIAAHARQIDRLERAAARRPEEELGLGDQGVLARVDGDVEGGADPGVQLAGCAGNDPRLEEGEIGRPDGQVVELDLVGRPARDTDDVIARGLGVEDEVLWRTEPGVVGGRERDRRGGRVVDIDPEIVDRVVVRVGAGVAGLGLGALQVAVGGGRDVDDDLGTLGQRDLVVVLVGVVVDRHLEQGSHVRDAQHAEARRVERVVALGLEVVPVVTLPVEDVVKLRAVVGRRDKRLHQLRLVGGAHVQHRQPVAVLVGDDVAEAERVASGVVVEGVEGVKDHVAIVGEVVVRENAAVAVVLEVERADADVTPDAEFARRLVAGRAVVVGLEDVGRADEFFPSVEDLVEQVLPGRGVSVDPVEPGEELRVAAAQTDVEVADEGPVGHVGVRQRGGRALGQPAPVGRGAGPAGGLLEPDLVGELDQAVDRERVLPVGVGREAERRGDHALLERIGDRPEHGPLALADACVHLGGHQLLGELARGDVRWFVFPGRGAALLHGFGAEPAGGDDRPAMLGRHQGDQACRDLVLGQHLGVRDRVGDALVGVVRDRDAVRARGLARQHREQHDASSCRSTLHRLPFFDDSNRPLGVIASTSGVAGW